MAQQRNRAGSLTTPMRSLSDSLRAISANAHDALPDESACPVCGYFDVTHPDVQRILMARDPTGVLLRDAECRCKERAAKADRDELLRHAQAGLPHMASPRTFDSFKRRDGAADALTKAERFARLEGPPLLFLLGETGTGKSHLLEAIARHVLATTGWHVRYDSTVRFLDRLRNSYTDQSRESLDGMLDWYQQRKVVLLDDLGLEKPTEWAVERLTEFVDERMVMGLLLAITSNLSADEMEARLGPRLASRLYQSNPELGEVARVTLTATDYRMVMP